MSGWYPDPGGAPDRYRYWDGSAWSDQTSPEPGPPPPPGPARSRRALLLGVIAAVAIALVFAGWFLDRSNGGRPYTDDPLPTSSVSGGDDSSPSRPPESVGPCASGQPNTRAPHAQDGRVHGGNLSFPAAPELDPAAPEARFSFAWDVTQQVEVVHTRPGWLAQLAVGQLRAADGFGTTAQRVAEQAIRCTITSNMYEPYVPVRADRRSSAISVDGRRGWLLETDIRVAVDGLPFPGDHVFMIVVPDGDDWGFFFSAVPIGDRALSAVATRSRDGLTVS